MAEEIEGQDTGAEAVAGGVDPAAVALALGGASRETAYAFQLLDPKDAGNVNSAGKKEQVRGIIIGNAIDGSLKYFIPDPGDLSKMTDTGTSATGIAEDTQGNIYAADVGENNFRKYERVQ